MSAPVTSAGGEIGYYRAQQRIVRAAVDQAQSAWRQLDPHAPSASWVEQVRPQVAETVRRAQQDAAALAPLYVAGVLAAARAVSAPLGALVSAAFAGLAANGWALEALLDFAFGYYRRARAAYLPHTDASGIGLARLLTQVATETADAGRTALHVASVVEPEVAGYERTVVLPACGRCVLLSGRLYRYSTGFPRHWRCDCTMHPVTTDQWREGGGAGRSPQDLFEQMTPAQQNRAFGMGGAAAIRAGADLGRVVNSRRAAQLYRAGGHEFTREATTTRGVGRQLGALAKSGGRYRRSQVPRPSAAQLVNTLGDDRVELLRQLQRFGYIR